MRHAILMTVYKDVELINRVLKSYPTTFDIFIHIDKKSGVLPTQINIDSSRVYSVYNINWGGLNHLKAFILLLKEALRGGYDYYHLVTGQDVFVQSQASLDKYISTYPADTCFIESFPIPAPKYTSWNSGWGIFDYYRFADTFNYNIKTSWGSHINGWSLKIQDLLHIRRKRPMYKTYIGSVYCSLSKFGVECIFNSPLYDRHLNRLKYTLCGEGVFFNTLLQNTNCPIVNFTLTYTDWHSSEEKPKVLDASDFEKWGKDKFFIRKIDMVVSSDLLNLLHI